MAEPGQEATGAPSGGVDRALSGLFGRDSLYVAIWALQIIAAAVVTPIATRLMPPEQFGVLASANAIMQVLVVFGGAGLSTAMQRQHAQGNTDNARRLFAVAVLISVGVSVCAYLAGPWWSRLLGFAHFDAVLELAVVWAGTSAVTGCAIALLRSQDRLVRFILVSVAQSVVAEVTSLLLLLAFHAPAGRLFVLGQVIGQLIAMTLGLIFVVPLVPRRTDLSMVRQSLEFALPLIPFALSGFVLSASDRLILQKLLGSSAVGGYQVAYSVGSLPMLVVALLSSAWLPRLFSLVTDRAAVLAGSRDAINRLLCAVVVGMALGGPVVLRIWAPASYRPDDLRLTLTIVVVSVVPYAANGAVTRNLLTTGRTRAVAVGNVVAALMNVLLNFVLVPHLQVVGAAVATLLSYTALWLILLLFTRGALRIPPAPGRLIALLLGCAAFAVASAIIPVGGWYLVVRIMLAIGALGWLVLSVRDIRQSSRTVPAPLATT